MTTREARGLAAADSEEESIAAYLQRHPEFFERHQGVLARLKLPHAREHSRVALEELGVALQVGGDAFFFAVRRGKTASLSCRHSALDLEVTLE